MKLINYYRDSVVYPTVFILFFSIVYAVLYNLKSNGLTDSSAMLMSVAPPVIFALLMCVLSLTIFLNKLRKLHKNLMFNILTWFLLPYGYITVILIHDIQARIKFEFRFGSNFLYLLVMTAPFVIGLCLTFLRYRQETIT